MDLGAEHDGGEREKQEPLKAQEDEQDHRHWRRETTALSPLPSDTGDELEPTEDERVHRGQRDVHSEEHKKPLILLPHAVVHPGAVMIHFPNASFANTAVVGTLGLDAAALGALVDHLSRLQLQALHEFLCGVSFGYRPQSTALGHRR